MSTALAKEGAAAEPAAGSGVWQPTPYGNVTPSGELGRRLRLSFQRLAKYPLAYTMAANGEWPGDREGRALLGQVLTEQAMGAPTRQADELVAAIKARLNPKGYLGAVMPEGIVDEQVLSGHSWLLRGLIEYHRFKHDDASLQMIRGIVENLLLPTRAHYLRYPITAKDRPRSDKADGTIVGSAIAGWRLSSDIGCAFIMLDGATSAYDLMPSAPLKELIEIMIARFKQIDLIAVNAQTHATLSATRAILRFAQSQNKPQLVAFAEKVFDKYKTAGMTEHFANDNWFGRPVWTEGCAIVDSFDVAMLLWQATLRSAYLEDAQNIYFNGIGYNQRPNGGFGCDSCPGSDGTLFLSPSKQMFEAPNCCSMRGGEGMAHATAWLVATRNNEIALTTLQNFTARLQLADGEVDLAVTTSFPFAGHTQVRIRKVGKAGATARIFLPSWVQSERIVVKSNGKITPVSLREGWLTLPGPLSAGQTFDVDFPIELRIVGPINPTKVPAVRAYRHGPLVLGVATVMGAAALVLPEAGMAHPLPHARYRFDGPPAIVLEPVTGLAFLPEAKAKRQVHQILFAAPAKL